MRVGAAMFGSISKAITLPVIALVAAFGRTERWQRIACAAAALICAPLWVDSLWFQLKHAYQPHGWSPSAALLAVLTAAAGQLVLWCPIVAVLGVQKYRAQPPLHRALIFALSFLFFGSAIIRAVPPEPNWLAPVGLIIIIGAAEPLAHATNQVRWLAGLLGPGLTLAFALHVLVPWLPIAISADPSARLHGWSSLHPPDGAPGVGAYGLAAEACVYCSNCGQIKLYISNGYMDVLQQLH